MGIEDKIHHRNTEAQRRISDFRLPIPDLLRNRQLEIGNWNFPFSLCLCVSVVDFYYLFFGRFTSRPKILSS